MSLSYISVGGKICRETMISVCKQQLVTVVGCTGVKSVSKLSLTATTRT